jgi:hypothetical protein
VTYLRDLERRQKEQAQQIQTLEAALSLRDAQLMRQQQLLRKEQRTKEKTVLKQLQVLQQGGHPGLQPYHVQLQNVDSDSSDENEIILAHYEAQALQAAAGAAAVAAGVPPPTDSAPPIPMRRPHRSRSEREAPPNAGVETTNTLYFGLSKPLQPLKFEPCVVPSIPCALTTAPPTSSFTQAKCAFFIGTKKRRLC